jgi:hypothetical protein
LQQLVHYSQLNLNIEAGFAMKIFVFFAILFLGFFVAITAAVRPDIVEKQYMAARAPIDQHFADKRAATWKEAKDQERAIWMLKQKQLPSDCKTPKTAIREMECKNIKQLRDQAFEKEWDDRIKSGWKPEDV